MREPPATSRLRGRKSSVVPPSSTSQRPTNLSPKSHRPKAQVDLVFLQDVTGSQRPYINAVAGGITRICDKLLSSSAVRNPRFGLVVFCDYPSLPKDSTFVTRNFGFTSDICVMRQHLKKLVAKGGGDGPEAQAAALYEALNMDWREDAIKIVVLITDSPPHGIGEKKDAFPQGSPDHNDPIVLARMMAKRRIKLCVLACEPTLSTEYQYASEFYRALVKITSGRMFPLISASDLAVYIIGAVRETLDTEEATSKYRKYRKRLRDQDAAVEDVAGDVQDDGVTITTITVEDIYTRSAQSQYNQDIWYSSPNLAAGRRLVGEVEGPRLSEKFQGGEVSPSIRLKKRFISMEQIKRSSTTSLRQP